MAGAERVSGATPRPEERLPHPPGASSPLEVSEPYAKAALSQLPEQSHDRDSLPTRTTRTGHRLLRRPGGGP